MFSIHGNNSEDIEEEKQTEACHTEQKLKENTGHVNAMFNNIQNLAIFGGHFVQHNVSSATDDNGVFNLLQKRVASSAFHNSSQRADPPRCHPDTRTAILQTIFDWITQPRHDGENEKWLLWLNGAAGAGKSAIMQSIIERCILQVADSVGIASFFLFRADSTRNTLKSLVATLAYQLILAIPETSDDILGTIDRDPLIFEQAIGLQLQELIIHPLIRLPMHLRRQFVVLIDGLDECINPDHQSDLINVLGDVYRSGEDIPVKFLIASRREPVIENAFLRKDISGLLRTIRLDNSDVQQTSLDIRRFVTNRFNDIKETHLRKHLLPNDWPPFKAVNEIVAKSSGQFIYASVVVNFVALPRSNPGHQLEIVRGIRLQDTSSQNPFAHLDALYQHIFSQVQNLDKVLDILAVVLISKLSLIKEIEMLFMLSPGELEVCLADLTAIIECQPHTQPLARMKFLHASLPDFLQDRTRSERYHIDLKEYSTKLICMALERPLQISPFLSPERHLDVVSRRENCRLHLIKTLLKQAPESERLRSAFMNFDITFPRAEKPRNNAHYAYTFTAPKPNLWESYDIPAGAQLI
ncbi:hypothetical protein BDN70DRAFT_932224 [Pholiota conissans]|uniref:Nephrocystin 3-like N-terminal domain-containing protein n=1 Tax=Pholiota conissans TaxID=109636 RepID=A0A9P5Z4P8_9AGAR|nr:hypothetical protein BDN70DRAFT_932224 [Pholiota conissans]